MYYLNLIAVFVRDQVRNFPIVHRYLGDFVYADIVKRHPPVLSQRETIDIIVRNKASIARYGDGEYKLCRNKSLRFQRNANGLARRLREILHCNIPNFHAAIRPLPDSMESGWWSQLIHNYRVVANLDSNPPRLNACIGYFERLEYIDEMKRIWQNRDVVSITNAETFQMATACNLFANAKSQDFISAPSEQAFSEYASILQQAKGRHPDTLFVMACGPTATVLAFDLHVYGFQAVDIGSFIRNAHDHCISEPQSASACPAKVDR